MPLRPISNACSPIVIDMSYLGTIGYFIRRAQIAVFQNIYRTFGDQAVTLVQFSVLAVAADTRRSRRRSHGQGARVLQELKRRFAEHNKALVQLLGHSKPLVQMDLHRLCTLSNS